MTFLLEFAVKMHSEPYSSINCGADVPKADVRLERDFEAKYGTFSMDLVVFIDRRNPECCCLLQLILTVLPPNRTELY